eukprot:g979.t1
MRTRSSPLRRNADGESCGDEENEGKPSSFFAPKKMLDSPKVLSEKNKLKIFTKILKGTGKYKRFNAFVIQDALVKAPDQRSAEEEEMLSGMIVESLSRSDILKGLRRKCDNTLSRGDFRVGFIGKREGPWFANIDETFFLNVEWGRRLLHYAECNFYRKGNCIYQQGDEASNVYLLVYGHVICEQIWSSDRPALKTSLDLRQPGKEKNFCALLSDRALLGLDLSRQRLISELLGNSELSSASYERNNSPNKAKNSAIDAATSPRNHRCTKEAIGGCRECADDEGLSMWNDFEDDVFPTVVCPSCWKVHYLSHLFGDDDESNATDPCAKKMGKGGTGKEESNDDKSDARKPSTTRTRELLCENVSCNRKFLVTVPSSPSFRCAAALRVPRQRRHTHTLRALDNCTVLKIPRQAMDEMIAFGRMKLALDKPLKDRTRFENRLLGLQLHRCLCASGTSRPPGDGDVHTARSLAFESLTQDACISMAPQLFQIEESANIFTKGTVDDRYYIVLDGSVQIFTQPESILMSTKNGTGTDDELRIGTFSPGTSFGENSLLSEGFERPYWARAHNGTVVLACLSGEKYRQVLRSYRALAIAEHLDTREARKICNSQEYHEKDFEEKNTAMGHSRAYIRRLTLAMGAGSHEANAFVLNGKHEMEHAIGNFLYDAVKKTWPRAYALGAHERTASFFTRRVCFNLVKNRALKLMRAKAGEDACAMYSGRGNVMYVLVSGHGQLSLMLKGRATPLIIATPIGSAIGHSTLLDQTNADQICSLREIKGEKTIKSALSRQERLLLKTGLKTREQVNKELREKGLLSIVEAIDDSIFITFNRSDYKKAVHEERGELLARQEKLRSMTFFSGASEIEVALIAQHVDARTLKRGDVVAKCGDRVQGVVVIIRGEVVTVDDAVKQKAKSPCRGNNDAGRGGDDEGESENDDDDGGEEGIATDSLLDIGRRATKSLLGALPKSSILFPGALLLSAEEEERGEYVETKEVHINTILVSATPTVIWTIDRRFLFKMSESFLKTMRRRARGKMSDAARSSRLRRRRGKRRHRRVEKKEVVLGGSASATAVQMSIANVSKDGQYTLRLRSRRNPEEWIVRSFRLNELKTLSSIFSAQKGDAKHSQLMRGREEHFKNKMLRSTLSEKRRVENEIYRERINVETKLKNAGRHATQAVVARRFLDGTRRAALAQTSHGESIIASRTRKLLARLRESGKSAELPHATATRSVERVEQTKTVLRSTKPKPDVAAISRESKRRYAVAARVALESTDAWMDRTRKMHASMGTFWNCKTTPSVRRDHLLRGQFSNAAEDSYATVRDRYLESPYDVCGTDRGLPPTTHNDARGKLARSKTNASGASGTQVGTGAACGSVERLIDSLDKISRSEMSTLRTLESQRARRMKGLNPERHPPGAMVNVLLSTRGSAASQRRGVFFPRKALSRKARTRTSMG